MVSEVGRFNYASMDNLTQLSLFSTTDSLTNEDQSSHCIIQILYTTFTIQTCICIFGTSFNCLVCIIIAKFNHLHTTFNALVFTLAAGDLLASAVAIPVATTLGHTFLINKHSLQEPLCTVSVFLLHLPKWHSLLIMTEMPIIRAIGVTTRRPWKPTKYTIFGIIIFNVFATVTFSVYRGFFTETICQCVGHTEKNGHMLLNVAVFVMLFVTLAGAYAWLSLITRKRAAKIAPAVRANKMPMSRFDIITLRTSIIIVLSYIVFHVPYILYTLLLDIGTTDNHSYCSHSFVVVCTSLTYIANPVIFYCTSKDCRMYVLVLLRIKSPPRDEA